MVKNSYILCCILCLFSLHASGQRLTIGGGFGFTSYVGDLHDGRFVSYLSNWKPIVLGEMNYKLNRHFTVGMQLGFAKIYGSDALSSKAWMKERNLSFNSNLLIFGFRAEAQLHDVYREENKPVTFYLTSGLEVLHFNPTTRFNGKTYYLQELGTGGQGIPGYGEKYKLWTVGIPTGGGIKIRIMPGLVMRLELVYHKLFTDYLDDVSADALLPYDFLKQHNGEIAASLSYRAWEYLEISPYDYQVEKRAGSRQPDGIINGHISIHYTLSYPGKQ